MAHPLRIDFPGAIYHVINFGNAMQGIVVDHQDRTSILTLLAHMIHHFKT